MRRRRSPARVAGSLALLCASAAAALPAAAGTSAVTGGRTSVRLDAGLVQSAAGLTVSGTSPEVIAPGLFPGSVAFPINARGADPLPTTFSYDPADFLGSFAGTIEHQGSLFFNAGAIEVGDFTVAYDASRAGGAASGFYVESNAGLEAVLFDVGSPSTLTPGQTSLRVDADLLVSPEFGQLLLTQGLATANLAGADVGDVFVEGAATFDPGPNPIPLPPAGWAGLMTLAGLAGWQARRRRLAAIAGA